MRIILIAAYTVLLAGSAPAFAEDCSKGLLWPFMRSAGECLTQTEKSQGMTGVYRGTSDAEERATPLQTPPASAPNATSSGVTPAPAKVSAAPVPAPTTPLPQAVAETPPPGAASASCQKGWLWPFVREPGDCLTDTDRKNGIVR